MLSRHSIRNNALGGMVKKRFSAVGEWEGPEYPELGQIESAVNSLKTKGVSAYYGRADDPSASE